MMADKYDLKFTVLHDGWLGWLAIGLLIDVQAQTCFIRFGKLMLELSPVHTTKGVEA